MLNGAASRPAPVRFVVAALVLVAVALGLARWGVVAAAPPPPAAVPAPADALVSLAAFLFHDSGVVGDDDVTIAPTDRHIPPGALDAPTAGAPAGPSHATLVVIGVARAPGPRPITVSFTATAKSQRGPRLLVETSVRLPATPAPAGAATAILHVPFVVHDTGCATLQLTATLAPARKGAVARLERLVPFHCGE